MKRLILTSLLLSQIAYARPMYITEVDKPVKPFVVAIIDTGIDEALLKTDTFCKKGHKDFTGTGIQDRHGHGTHISGLVDQYARNYIFTPSKDPNKLYNIKVNYCQIVIKFFDTPNATTDNLENTRKAIRYAIDMNVDMINYSGGGTDYDSKEHDLIVEALNNGIKVVAAAGNEKSNINKDKYYPAMYDARTYRVGSLVSESPRVIASYSNFGDGVNNWEMGTKVLSRLPGGIYGYMTGTSQAAAIKSGKLVHELAPH